MKTHTSRWYTTVDGKIHRLRERTRDGGATLAIIVKSINTGYCWKLGESDTGLFNWAPTYYAAQRKVRKALHSVPQAARLCELAAVRLRGGSPEKLAALSITERAMIETIARSAIDAERELREANRAGEGIR